MEANYLNEKAKNNDVLGKAVSALLIKYKGLPVVHIQEGLERKITCAEDFTVHVEWIKELME
ncbi:MAG: hypothetical protein GYA87_05245 [Christensenellaceae bacterium]|nr:hypothetical protein [Christensenellaceae bacterium]